MNAFTRTTAVLATAALLLGGTAVGANAAIKQPSVYDSIGTSTTTASTTYIPRWRF